MNFGYFFAMFGSIMIGTELLASGGLISNLAHAKMYPRPPKQAVVEAKNWMRIMMASSVSMS